MNFGVAVRKRKTRGASVKGGRRVGPFCPHGPAQRVQLRVVVKQTVIEWIRVLIARDEDIGGLLDLTEFKPLTVVG